MSRFAPLIRHRALLIAAGAFVLFAIWAVHLSPWSAPAMEARLEQRAIAALERVGEAGWAQVSVSGQRLTLSGYAPSEEARARALRVAMQADWAGGVIAGGVTRLIDETRMALPEAGLALRLDLAGSSLVVRGFAPDPGAMERIALISEAFSTEADVFLEQSTGQMPDGWEQAVRHLLGELMRLETGTGFMLEEGLALAGLAARAQTAESVAGGFMSSPAPFGAASHVRAGSRVYGPRLRSVQLCDLLVQAALGPDGSALEARGMLAESARSALAEAGSAFSRCERGEMIITLPRAAGTPFAEALMQAVIAGGASPSRVMVRMSGPAGSDAITLEVAARAAAEEEEETGI